jgi:hypothetical protein
MTPSRSRRLLAGAALAACAAFAATSSAQAAVGPAGIRDGRNITVFHNIDFVAAFGHAPGEAVQVDVVRGGHRVATARGSAVPTPEGGALEVNHGTEGAPLPGDCWEGATPDVRPGDLVRVTTAGGVDEVVVDDITIDTVTRQPGANAIAGDNDDEIWVQGVARSGLDGSPIDAGILDSGEFRDPLNGQLRMEPNEVVAGAAAGTYVAKYRAPFTFVKGATSTPLALEALLRDGHAFGFGHVPLPSGALRPDAMLVEGMGLANGPALGCEASAAAASSIGSTSLDALNAATLGALAPGDVALTVGGWAADGVGTADVELRDEAGATVVKPVTLTGGAGQQGWGATFTKAEVLTLAQGALSARLVGAGAVRTVVYDTVVPAFTAGLPAGTYTGAQRVAISGDPVTYQLDGGFPRSYTGIPIELGPGAHTLVLRAEDDAGNVATQTLAYDIRALPAPPAPPAAIPPAPPAAAPVIGPAPVTLVAAAAQRSPASLVPTILGARGRVGRAQARRAGLTARFRAPAGTRTATVTVSRMAGGALRFVGSKRARVRPGRATVRLDARSLRTRLRPGLYYVEVVLRGAGGRSGDPAAAFVRVLR